MEIHFLGTGSAYPSPRRSASCTALRHQNGSIYLFDCGEGTQIQIQKSTIRPGKISKIFITHLHGDHLFGLVGLLCTIGMNGSTSNHKIDIYGPNGLRNYICTVLSLSYSILPYKFQVHEIMIPRDTELESPLSMENVDKLINISSSISQISTVELPLHPCELESDKIYPSDGNHYMICRDDSLVIKAGLIKHSIPCLGYVLEEDDRVGKLDVQYLQSLGVKPGPLYGKLKMGESICLDNGQLISPSECLGPNISGKKIVILGDTYDPTNIRDIAINADLLIHESTNENADKEKSIEHGHSTAGMAGAFAKSINAKKLVLTHFSQRYYPIDHKSSEQTVSILLNEAMETFESKNIVAAEDLMILRI